MGEPLVTAVGQLAGTGITGVVAAIFLYLYLQERKAAKRAEDDRVAEMNHRVEDAQKFNTLAMSLQKEVITAVQALTKIANHLEKQDEDKERLERELAMRQSDTGQFKALPVPPRPTRPRAPSGRREKDEDADE